MKAKLIKLDIVLPDGDNKFEHYYAQYQTMEKKARLFDKHFKPNFNGEIKCFIDIDVLPITTSKNNTP